MNIQNLKNKISKIGTIQLNYKSVLIQVAKYKRSFAEQGNETEAKQFWILQEIVEIHKDYSEAFNLLKTKRYLDAWNVLGKIEISFSFLKKHLAYDNQQYKLYFIEKAVRNLQALYPYKLFTSHVIIKKEQKCSICDKVISIRNPCGHKAGEIYGGELCLRNVTQCDIRGFDIVQNPVDKFAVLFPSDTETNEAVDNNSYETIEYLMDVLSTPYEPWDVIISERLFAHSDFKADGEDYCPCGTVKKYKDCCLDKEGIKGLHYEFLVKNPSAKNIIANTKKRS